jgi:enoyl-CoA hydratase/carnithine racemase
MIHRAYNTIVERVLSQIVDGVAVLTLNHPERRNALSREMLSQLEAALERVVILRANGPVFSAGHDLREVSGGDRAAHVELFALCTRVMEKLRHLPQPVIAEVHALATAAGCQLAASCDLVVASEEARFATPGVKIGLFCTTPGVALSRAVPAKKAMEMLLTGEAISAREAEAAGLVNRVVPASALHDETMALAKKIMAASAEVLAMGKRAFYQQQPLDRASAYALAEGAMVDNAALDDAREGMAAFLEKRAPRWRR